MRRQTKSTHGIIDSVLRGHTSGPCPTADGCSHVMPGSATYSPVSPALSPFPPFFKPITRFGRAYTPSGIQYARLQNHPSTNLPVQRTDPQHAPLTFKLGDVNRQAHK